MESLADHARENFSGGYGPFSDTDSDEGPVEVDAKDVANAIVHSALDGFEEVGHPVLVGHGCLVPRPRQLRSVRWLFIDPDVHGNPAPVRVGGGRGT